MIERAFISGPLGRAIYEEDGRSFTIGVAASDGPVECRQGDLSFLVNPDAEFVEIPGQDIALDDVRAALERENRKHRALHLLISGLDADLSEKTRWLCVDAAEDLIGDESVRAFVSNRLLSRVMPAGADTKVAGEVANLIDTYKAGQVYADVINSQQAIGTLLDAWDGAARGVYASEREKALAEKRLIDLGVFAELVAAVRTGDRDRITADLGGRLSDSEVLEKVPKGREVFAALQHRLLTLLPTPRPVLSKAAVAEKVANVLWGAPLPPSPILGGVLWKSKGMQQVLKQIEFAARNDANVLIVGEPGTGKEMIAEAIHSKSSFSTGPLVKVSCAALPKEMLEYELLGPRQGAFTSARHNEGAIARAGGGTLILDEVAELPILLQGKLGRFLEERAHRPVGGQGEARLGFRLICTTNRKLPDLIGERLMRADLYYRISPLTIEVPPLRELREDIAPLAFYFLKLYAAKHKRPARMFSAGAILSLSAYGWPGNVREFRGAIERAVLRSDKPIIDVPDLRLFAIKPSAPPARTQRLEDMERTYILRVLAESRGNLTRAAVRLSLQRRQLDEKIKKHNLGPFITRE
ncbi:MAG TPA: sigma 54-interacting transcriptional regulator [Blastocatellia bacterium]|nr:sigma 54-interacting transcriptional regulator [Blastocatellia bacterium]